METDSAEAEISSLLDSKRDDPDVQEVILESFRRIMESFSEEAIRPIALLTREYVKMGKGDYFFRGLGRVLSDLSGDEIRDLRVLMQELADQIEGTTFQLQLLGTKMGGEPFDLRITRLEAKDDGMPKAPPPTSGRTSHSIRASPVSLLKVAWPGSGGIWACV